MRKSTILVCIDNSSASKIALRYACLKAKKLNSSVNILSVIETSHRNFLFGSQIIGEQKRQQTEKYLKKLVENIKKEIDIEMEIMIKEGDVAKEIIKAVKRLGCCIMVILGKSYNLQSDNNVLPKIAQKIGSKIQIPIMIVPENIDEELFKLLS